MNETPLITISRARNPPVKGLRGDEKEPRVRRIVERCKGQEGRWDFRNSR